MTLRNALVAALIVAASATVGAERGQAQQPASLANEVLHYSAEWRFVRAGEVEVRGLDARQTTMRLLSSGLVSRLFHVEDSYTMTRDEQGCNKSLVFKVREGRRSRDITANFDKQRRRASFLERDLNRDAIVTQKESEIPGCVYDLPGGLRQLRAVYPKPGTSMTWPVSDGKKTAMIRVEAQEKEQIRTPLGEFRSMRYEAFLFGGAFYGRKGRLFVWLTDDERRLPIQLRIQLPFYVGTITLQLERIERN